MTDAGRVWVRGDDQWVVRADAIASLHACEIRPSDGPGEVWVCAQPKDAPPEKPLRLWQLARVQGNVTAKDAVANFAKAIAGAQAHEAHALFICAITGDDGGPVWCYETTAPAGLPPGFPRPMVEETTQARVQRLGSDPGCSSAPERVPTRGCPPPKP
jgi:hypothetical protein